MNLCQTFKSISECCGLRQLCLREARLASPQKERLIGQKAMPQELCDLHLARKIHDDSELEATQAILDGEEGFIPGLPGDNL